jgi:hypothetical protein
LDSSNCSLGQSIAMDGCERQCLFDAKAGGEAAGTKLHLGGPPKESDSARTPKNTPFMPAKDVQWCLQRSITACYRACWQSGPSWNRSGTEDG